MDPTWNCRLLYEWCSAYSAENRAAWMPLNWPHMLTRQSRRLFCRIHQLFRFRRRWNLHGRRTVGSKCEWIVLSEYQLQISVRHGINFEFFEMFCLQLSRIFFVFVWYAFEVWIILKIKKGYTLADDRIWFSNNSFQNYAVVLTRNFCSIVSQINSIRHALQSSLLYRACTYCIAVEI